MRKWFHTHGGALQRILKWGGTLISLGLFGWLIARQDWAGTMSVLRSFPWWLLVLAYTGFLLGQAMNAWRWYMVLRLAKIALPYPAAMKIVFLGAFASNFLPSTVGGDTVRYISLLRFTEKKGMGVLSLLVDRLLKMISMLTLSPFSIVLFGPVLADILGRRTTWPEAAFIPAKVQDYWQRAWSALVVWFRNPVDFLHALGVAWLSVFPQMLATLGIAHGLGMSIGLQHIIGASVITYFVTLLPIAINGYGLQEISVTVLYTSLGVNLEQSVALALITRVLMLAATLPGALWLPEILALKADNIDNRRQTTDDRR
ncbi:MAG: UPF0104 family protein [Calditrichaeota bacterium]|nr:MAG: UPF0104 family protein [Calditrichota bacterium]